VEHDVELVNVTAQLEQELSAQELTEYFPLLQEAIS